MTCGARSEERQKNIDQTMKRERKKKFCTEVRMQICVRERERESVCVCGCMCMSVCVCVGDCVCACAFLKEPKDEETGRGKCFKLDESLRMVGVEKDDDERKSCQEVFSLPEFPDQNTDSGWRWPCLSRQSIG